MEQAAAGNIGHEAQRGGGESRPVHALSEIGQQVFGIAAGFGKFGVEPLSEDLITAVVRRQVWQRFQVIVRMLKHCGAEIPSFVGVAFQRLHRRLKRLKLVAASAYPAISMAASVAW